MIIDHHSNKSIIGIYNIIDYDNRLIVPAVIIISEDIYNIFLVLPFESILVTIIFINSIILYILH